MFNLNTNPHLYLFLVHAHGDVCPDLVSLWMTEPCPIDVTDLHGEGFKYKNKKLLFILHVL